MVMPGQFLERPALIRVKNFHLDGLYQGGKKAHGRDSSPPVPALIAPAHPHFGGRMSSPPVLEICYALFTMGYPTLRFDFRGAGASQGKMSHDPEKAREDFLASAAFLREATGCYGYIAAGYSFGACVAYECSASEPILKLILLAPRLVDMAFFSLPLPRCPVLIISGDSDPSCPVDMAQTLLSPLKDRGSLRIVAGADHAFVRGLGDISTNIRDFLRPSERD